MRGEVQGVASRSESRHRDPQAVVRPQKRAIACHRCHAQKIKCSGEKPCSRCRRAGYAAQCRYANRDRKIRVDESYLEQLIQDSQELHERRTRASLEAHTHHEELTKDGPRQSSEVARFLSHDHTVGETPWFQPHGASVLPIYISEAACTAFATRLCQCLRRTDLPTLHLPRWRYTDESTLASLLHIEVQWPSLVYAELLVKTALAHINLFFHSTLKKETLDVLHNIYQKEHFNHAALKCKYFALFAVGQVYSTPCDPTNTSTLPGTAFFARAMSLLQIIPERPSMVHIECLLLLAYFCQFLNRFHSSYLLIGNALRLSLSLGLNYNVPKSQNLHPIEREHRVRIWWSIYVLDRFWGSKSGFPVQIHDDDIHVDLPSTSVSEPHGEQFPDAAYQVAAIELAKITGDTTREIYTRKESTESFLQREKKLLIRLKQWVQSLPEHVRLHADKPNSKHTVLLHLQFSYCVILTIRPVLLNLLICHTKNHPIHPNDDDVTSILKALTEACFHAARYSLKLCQDEWVSGSVTDFGYSFPAFVFSSALVLVISSVLPWGSPSDIASVDTATEILKILNVSNNLAAKDLHEHLQRVRQCLHSPQSDSATLIVNEIDKHPITSDSAPGHSTSMPSASYDYTPLYESSFNVRPTATSDANALADQDMTTEMALHDPLMQSFLTQSAIETGHLSPAEVPNDFDVAFLWATDTLYTE